MNMNRLIILTETVMYLNIPDDYMSIKNEIKGEIDYG